MATQQMQTIEIIVPVRPGSGDRFPVSADPDRIQTRVIECPDGNLSGLWRDAYGESNADVVVFKHDDFWFRGWYSFESQLWSLMDRYPIIGVAGARSYSPRRVAWWQQSDSRHAMIDGINRGMVSHPTPSALRGVGRIGDYCPTLFGPPGPAVVLDGCCIAVCRNFANDPFGQFSIDEVLNWWDLDFTHHFYDIVFTLNATQACHRAGLGTPCYVVVADVVHESGGPTGPEYVEAAKRFSQKYSLDEPICAELAD